MVVDLGQGIETIFCQDHLVSPLFEEYLGAAPNGVAVVDDEYFLGAPNLGAVNFRHESVPPNCVPGRVNLEPLQHAQPIGSKLHHLEVFLACTAFRTDPVHGNVLPARARRDALLRQAGGLIVNPATDQAHPGTKFVHVDSNQLEYNGLIVAIGLSHKPKGLWASRPYLSRKPP